jgi:hypothetical protein
MGIHDKLFLLNAVQVEDFAAEASFSAGENVWV